MTDAEHPTADQVRAEIEQTRADLGATANALADKLNVKAQAGRKVDDAREWAADPDHRPVLIGAAAAVIVAAALLIWRRRSH